MIAIGFSNFFDFRCIGTLLRRLKRAFDDPGMPESLRLPAISSAILFLGEQPSRLLVHLWPRMVIKFHVTVLAPSENCLEHRFGLSQGDIYTY
jgi:hypothetical protein